jgi:oligopeptide/dipeptide ABC transporter ATP-binding protein
MSSLPRLDVDLEQLEPIPGAPPDLIDLPTGCSFHPRCRLSRGREICRTEVPPLRDVGDGQLSACHFADEVPAEAAVVSGEMGTQLGTAAS